ncbi:adhesion G protein-coupled receptor L4-like isoform X3 [Dysidea avara]
MIFSPTSWCYCGHSVSLTGIHVCIGPGVPPCVMTSNGYECKSPIYAGNGIMCGLDSDGDGYPDNELPCAYFDERCEEDVCPDVYSAESNDCTACDPSCDPDDGAPPIEPVVAGSGSGDLEPIYGGSGSGNPDNQTVKVCPSEVDEIWLINWPQTEAGFQAVTRCSGNDSVGLVTRNCFDNGSWGEVRNVTNCYSAELSILHDDSRQLNTYYFGDDGTNEIDYTESLSLNALSSSLVSRDLSSRTKSSIPLAPQDLNVANDILHMMISLLGYDETDDVSTVAKDLSSTINNLLSESNMVTYEFVDSNQDEDKPNEAESLFNNIESFASTFRSILEFYQLHNVSFSGQNFDIDFELLSTFDLQSTGGVEFAVENSKIFIPNAAIKEQMSSEGAQVPIVNYAAQNLVSVLPDNSIGDTTVIANEVISSQISSQPISLPPDGYVTLTFNNVEYPAYEMEPTCVFWNSTIKIGNNTGGWSEEGVFLDVENTNSTTITCVTKHLTSFSVLFRGAKKKGPRTFDTPITVSNNMSLSNTSLSNSTTINQAITETSADDEALSIVSYIGCGISIICLLATIIIILLFRKTVFQPMQNIIHVNLSIALLLSLILFVSGIETANENRAACILVTVLLHYFFLATFSWMLCEGILIYVLLAKVFYEGFFKRLPFYYLVGWGLPIPIVVVTAGISHDHYGIYASCWLPTEKGIIWAFIAPVIFVIVCNSVIIVLAIYAIFIASRRKVKNRQMTEITAAKKLIRAALFLLPTLGVTWIFGVLAVNSEHVAFAWIFTILNSIEGLFIFVFYVLQNDKFIETMASYLGIQSRKRTRSSAVKLTSNDKHKTICPSATIETTTDFQKSDFHGSITAPDMENSAGTNNGKMTIEANKVTLTVYVNEQHYAYEQ